MRWMHGPHLEGMELIVGRCMHKPSLEGANPNVGKEYYMRSLSILGGYDSQSRYDTYFFHTLPRFNCKANRWSSGFRGCRVVRDLARSVAPIVQGKSGSSDPVETGGSQSAFRGSTFRETRSLPFFTAEIVDQRNAESTFGAKPTVLAPGHIKRACEWG
jgi:hypothetical protein